MDTKSRIRQKLEDNLAPELLEVMNESSQHNVPAGSETHFRLLIVTPKFRDLSRLRRHRRIHELLADELAQGVHALTFDAWTPEEWAAKGQASTSPACRGGSRG